MLTAAAAAAAGGGLFKAEGDTVVVVLAAVLLPIAVSVVVSVRESNPPPNVSPGILGVVEVRCVAVVGVVGSGVEPPPLFS